MMESGEVDKSQLPGFVYLMDDGRDYKVGLTGDITKRLARYMPENPRLELRDHFQCQDYKKAQEVEAELIESTKHFQTFGKEWREHTKEVLSIWKEIKHKHALMTHKQWANAFAGTAELQKQYEDRLKQYEKSLAKTEQKRRQDMEWIAHEKPILCSRIEELESKNTSYQSQLEEFKQAKNALTKESLKYRDEIKRLQDEIKRLQKQISELDESRKEQNRLHQSQLDKQKQQYSTQVKNLKKSILDLASKASGELKSTLNDIALNIENGDAAGQLDRLKPFIK